MSNAQSKAMDPRFAARLKKRYASERRFRLLGLCAVVFSALVLAFLIATMTANAIGGFKRTELRFPVDFAASALPLDPSQLSAPDARDKLKVAGLPDAARFGGRALSRIENELVERQVPRLTVTV